MEPLEGLAENSSIEKGKRASGIEKPRPKRQKTDRPLPELNESVEICNKQQCNENAFYSGLQDTDEIRLIFLHPGSSNEQIKCTVTNSKCLERLPYEALSYEWGPAIILKSIFVNGADFTIRENLWLALQHLRLESETRVLWIDAICINQYNVDERNHQVTQMGKIYSQATRVVVWLGAPDASSRIAFEVLLSVNWTEFIAPSNDIDKGVQGDHQLEAVLSLLTRNYWKRLWIIQEFLMAKNILIQSGDDKCTGFRVSWFMKVLGEPLGKPGGQVRGRRDTLNRIVETFPARLFRQRDPPTGPPTPLRIEPVSQLLLKLFMNYKEAECQDQRDKIFGLRSLAKTCCKDAMPVNYSLTWSLILQRLIRHQIIHHHSDPYGVLLLTDPEFRVQRFQRFYREVEERLPQSYIADMTPDLKTELIRPELKNIFIDFDDIFLRWAEKKIGSDLGYWSSERATPTLHCYLRGRVLYTSPHLSTDFTKQRPSVPEPSLMIKLQVKFLCSLVGHEPISHPHVTTEIDLVGHLPVHAPLFSFFDYAEGPGVFTSSGPQHTQKRYPIDYWGCNSWSDDESNVTENFLQLLFAAQKASPNRNCVLAFEENGLVFFAPKDINVGDMVCQFRGSDILAVAEIEEKSYQGKFTIERVRRAINFLASPPDVAVDICGKSMSFERAKPYRLQFAPERNFIRELCRMSKTPNGKHNIPIQGEIDTHR